MFVNKPDPIQSRIEELERSVRHLMYDNARLWRQVNKLTEDQARLAYLEDKVREFGISWPEVPLSGAPKPLPTTP